MPPLLDEQTSLRAELNSELESLEAAHRLRGLQSVERSSARRLKIGRRFYLNFSSNNYLGLAEHSAVQRAAQKALSRWGAGSGSSRLVAGDLLIHEKLEAALARFKREQSCLVFSSGFLANLGAVTALAGEQDLILVDRLNHASLIDAARLSRAKIWVYPHRDAGRARELLKRAGRFRRRWVLTDAYFSMDGDTAPLGQLLEICRETRSHLYVDEAHSVGVYGKSGAGLTEELGLTGEIDVVMGTLSKALGSVGGYVCGSEELRRTLIQKARTFVYTTAPSPAASAAALESLRVIGRSPSLRVRLWENARTLREALTAQGYDLMNSEGPIVPVKIGDSLRAVQCQEYLRGKGIYAVCIRPPTVPKGTDRIRLSVTASHTRADMALLCKAFDGMRRCLS